MCARNDLVSVGPQSGDLTSEIEEQTAIPKFFVGQTDFLVLDYNVLMFSLPLIR